jgi:outer membrane protein assembly factor BamA
VVKVTEVNPYIPAPAIKITEENGLEIGVSISSPNLFGRASRLSAWARFGGATNIGVRYKDPLMPDFQWFSGIQVDYFHMERRNKVFEFDETSDDFAFVYVPSYRKWLRAGPRISFLKVRSDQQGITLDPDNSDEIPGFGISLQLDSRNMPVYPTDGWWTEVLVSKFGIFDNDADYWQGNLDIRRYFQLDGNEQSLAIYSLTTLTSGEVGVDIPTYMQFTLGGANTVRGWDLGSRIGKNQFINTVEYWHILGPLRIYEVWFLKQALGLQGAVFADVGTAWTTTEEFHQNWIGGAGVGLRLLVPSLVMVRFDLGVGESGLGVGIFIGSQEKATLQRDRVR